MQQHIFSSERDNETLDLFPLNFFLSVFLVSPIKLIYGFPDFLLRIIISLKFIPFEIPVPKAFEKASFAANLFA